MSKNAIFPGTFDPITNGHLDLIKRASRIFDKVFLAVADSTSKKTLFNIDERMLLASDALSDLSNVQVISFNKLMVDCARQHNVSVILRGLRTTSDFEYEKQLAGMNRRLYAAADTFYLTPDEQFSCISSSLVREIAKLDGDVSELVPANVLLALNKEFGA